MTRMVGGTFGVAVLGAVFQSVGRDRVRESFAPLGVSLPKHLDLAKGLSEPSVLHIPPGARAVLAPKIATAAHDALVHAVSSAMLVGACVTLASAVGVWLLLLRPGRSAEQEVRAGEKPRRELAAISLP